MIHLTQTEFNAIAGYVRDKYGINLENKQYLIESKLQIELARYRADSYTAYWQMLRCDHTGEMEQRLVDQLTTNYSYFCREQRHFDYLKDEILPQFRGAKTPFRIWCAGCATGQECYTLAMLLSDAVSCGNLCRPYHILGTDISVSALKAAKLGKYPVSDWARLPARWQQTYCQPYAHGQFAVNPSIKENISFMQHNLLQPMLGEKFSLVSCRNVLIYFKDRQRDSLIENLIQAVEPGGYLFIGHTESLMTCPEGLEYIKPAVYRKKGAK